MRKRVKGLGIKKIGSNFEKFLTRSNCQAIVILFFKERQYQIKNKSDLDLFSHYLLTKRKNICKIQYLH
tara:strand:+ start:285 stop:491 length:207 start_codon:yes stop_codon:yes gene_type:complete